MSGKCVDNLPLGSACGSNNDACQSKTCTDGVCCKVASCGACKACGAGGECLPAKEGQSCGATTCAGDATTGATKTLQACKAGACAPSPVSCGEFLCDAAKTDCLAACTSDSQCKSTGYCDTKTAKCTAKKPVGQPCADAKECQNGQCVDGYCCASTCTGKCQRCDLAVKGQCAPIAAGQNPDKECGDPGSPQCIGTCDGKGGCTFPSGTITCKPSECSAAWQTDFFCQNGFCSNNGGTNCYPYLCDAAGSKCLTSCTKHTEGNHGYCDLIGLPEPARLNRCPVIADLCKPAPSAIAFLSCLGSSYYVIPADGTYAETLVTSRPNQVVALSATGPLLVGGVPQTGVAKVLLRSWDTNKPAIQIDHPIYIHGLDIAPSTGTGPLLYVNNHATIKTSWLHHATGAGISRTPTGTYQNIKVDLVDVAITNCNEGVSVKAVDLSLDRVAIGYSGGHGLVQIERTLRVRDALIAFNRFGTGLYTVNAVVDIDRAKIGANKKGLQLTSTTTGILWNVVANDNAEEGILVSVGSTPKLYNVTVAGNSGIGLDCGTPGIQVANSIIWGKTDSTSKANDCVFSYSNVRLPGGAIAGGTGNLDQDPGFVGSGSDPYSLPQGSPCVDVGADNLGGVTYPTTDVLGKPRKVDKPGGGSLLDLGAYELQ